MRTLSSSEAAALASSIGYSVAVSVEIKDANEVWRDLGALAGKNWLRSVSYDESVDDPGLSATVVLNKRLFSTSLAPLHETSRLNNLTGTYQPLIQVGREIRIKTATTPLGVPASAGDFRLVFQGLIGSVRTPGDTIEVTAIDASKVLVNTFIQRERAYSTAGGMQVEAVMQQIIDDNVAGLTWKPSTAYSMGDMVRPTVSNGFGYRVTVAGTSGATEPSWPTSPGATVTSGTVTLKRFQASPTLYTPASPAWVISEFKQAKGTVFDALDSLAKQIGWQVRYRHRASSDRFELTFLEPDRTGSSTVFTIGPDKYEGVKALDFSDDSIRNQVRVSYYDSLSLDAQGQPTLKSVYVEDSASLDKYGSRYMEIALSKSANIDTQAEATKLANAALSDLKEPVAHVELACQYLYHLELGDLILIEANDDDFTTDRSAAITGIRHTISAPDDDGSAEYSTSLTLRFAQPVSHAEGWRAVESTRGIVLTDYEKPTVAVSGTAVIGGVKLDVQNKATTVAGRVKPEPLLTSIHASQVSGFTPSAATEVAVTSDPNPVITGLQPGQTYYVKGVAKDAKGNLSLVSDETSFVAGQLSAVHFNPELGLVSGVPNGGFESYFGGLDRPPDHWEVVAGTYKAGGDLFRSTTSHSGAYSLELRQTATAAKLRSAFFSIAGGEDYELSAWIQRTVDTPYNISLGVEWYSVAKTLLSTSTYDRTTNSLGASWVLASSRVSAPATAAYAKVFVAKGSPEAYGALIDDLRLERLRPAPAEDSNNLNRSTASSTFAAIAATTVSQDRPNQRFLCFAFGSCWSNATAQGAGFRINFGGSVTTERVVFFNVSSEHQQFGFGWLVTGGPNPSASVSVSVEWRRSSGTASSIQMDTNDHIQLLVLPI